VHPFRYKGFAALWTGALISNVGTWMAMIALGVAVTEQTGRAAWTGTVTAMAFAPSIVLAPVAGALADRFERRRYLALLNGFQMAIAGAMTSLAFAGRLTPLWMAALALLTGVVNALAMPSFVALISELVPNEALAAALSLNSGQYNVGRIIGPALATAVFAVGGPPWAFLANTLSFGAVLYALWRVPPRAVPLTAPEKLPPLFTDVRAGVLAARDDLGIRLALGLVLATAVLIAPFIGLVPVYAMRVFNGGAATASAFTTAQGIGAVVAALALGAIVRRFGLHRVTLGALVLLGPCAIAYWCAPSVVWATLAIVLLGAVYLSALTVLNTLEQVRAKRAFQARIAAMHNMMLGGGYAASVIALGALADRFGLRLVLLVTSGAFTAGIVGLTVFARRLLRRLDETVQPVVPAAVGPVLHS
jgi:predicted MFS family arabinose efflux permease